MAESDETNASRFGWAAVAVLTALLFVLVWHLLTTEHAPKRRTLIVAAPDNEIVKSRLSPYGPGFETELVGRFCETRGLTPKWRFIKTWDEGWDLLERGEADVMLGAGLVGREDPRAPTIVQGPSYAASRAVMLYNVSRYEMYSLEQLCRRTLLIQDLEAFPELFELMAGDHGCEPVPPAVAPGLSMPPLLTMMEDEAARFAMVDAQLYQLWQPFFPEVRPSLAAPEMVMRRWYWRADSFAAGELAAYWEEEAKDVGANLNVRYFSFFPNDFDYYENLFLRRTVREDLDAHVKTMLRAAKKNRLDPLFLAAVIYQESRFDPHATSRTGVRGLMQISRITAEHLGVDDRTDPEESILAGARYLRQLHKRLEDYDLDPWNRWFVALAAYNQGFSHAIDALKLAEEVSLGERRWRHVKKAYKLLARPRYYTKAKYGYTRGYEAADYVSKIRFYYYVLKGLSVLPGPEREHLAPLAGAVPAGWPAI